MGLVTDYQPGLNGTNMRNPKQKPGAFPIKASRLSAPEDTHEHLHWETRLELKRIILGEIANFKYTKYTHTNKKAA